MQMTIPSGTMTSISRNKNQVLYASTIKRQHNNFVLPFLYTKAFSYFIFWWYIIQVFIDLVHRRIT